jgi:hypothetical protein
MDKTPEPTERRFKDAAVPPGTLRGTPRDGVVPLAAACGLVLPQHELTVFVTRRLHGRNRGGRADMGRAYLAAPVHGARRREGECHRGRDADHDCERVENVVQDLEQNVAALSGRDLRTLATPQAES